MVVGILIAVIIIAVLLIWGIPAIRNNSNTTPAPAGSANVNVTIPGVTGGSNGGTGGSTGGTGSGTGGNN